MSDDAVLPPFVVTQRAIDALEQLGGAVHIGVEDGGCCGRAWSFALGGSDPEGAVRFGCPGAWLDVAPEALDLLEGATLDYGAHLRPPRFRVLKNPNIADTCPCRRSFGQPWPGPKQPTCRSYAPMPWDDDFSPPAAWQRQTGWSRG